MGRETVTVKESDVIERVVAMQKILLVEDEHKAIVGATANDALVDVMALYVLAITHGDSFDKKTHAGAMDMAGQIARRLLMTEATEALIKAKAEGTIAGIRKEKKEPN